MREINSDADAEKVCSVAKGGVVSLYMEATGDPCVVADNEDADPGNEHGYATSDTEAEVYGIRAHEVFNYLTDDSDRTNDLEFHQAMENLGISGLRRMKVRDTYQADGGTEVDQLNEAAVNGVQQEEVLIDVEDVVEMDFMNMKSMEYQNPNSDADAEDSDFELPIGKDGNNQMYPIDWAVVEGENHSSWTWVLDIIREHLDMADGTGWLPAILLPGCESSFAVDVKSLPKNP
ncbi:hypothetical protein LINPERHAP2_LOCUS28817 [Linum perenne]